MKPFAAESLNTKTGEEDIAIIGMACFFPGADTVGRYWENIVHKVDCVGDPPADWQPELFLNPAHPDRAYTGKGGYLRDLARFHPARYGIMPNSIEGAEPDHFLAFRCAVEALADAGYPDIPVGVERTGVILGRGIFINRGLVTMIAQGYMVDQMVEVLRQIEPQRSEEDFALIRASLKKNLPPFNAETVPGLTHNVLAARIANRLNFQGPTYTVDAACASTLLAVEHGLRELRSGRCDAILAGGVQVSTPGMVHQAFSYLQALSRSGKIAPFSSEANGTLLGQGCGVLVLKRRSDAERDGNRIYALLKSVGISSDGKAMGLLAPRQAGQELCIRRAYEGTDVDPGTVELIEAHGTGIPLGDATEIRSLTSCFGQRRESKPHVAIGSVKSMISHLIPASGAASLIKTALALYHRVLPPTLHAEQVNPELGLQRTPFYLCTETRPWIHGRRDAPRRAAVDAFGFGGINAHAVLEEHSGVDETTLPRLERQWPSELVIISADDRAALRERIEHLDAWLQRATDVALLDVAAAAARQSGPTRVAIIASDLDDLHKKLQTTARLLAEPNRKRIQDRSGIFWYDEPLARHGRVAFVFPGEGAQYTGMLADLCRHFPEVRREFDLTDAAFAKSAFGQPLSRLIFPLPDEREEAERDLFQLGRAVTSVTLASRALLSLMNRLGVRADAILGHSSGEFGALMAAGVIAPQGEDGLIAALAEGADNAVRLAQSGLVPPAVLTAVGGARAEAVEAALAACEGKLVVAMDNCPSQQVLVGDEESTARALDLLRGKGGLCERLPWGRAYHTDAFAPACSIIEDYYDKVPLAPAQVELWSCVTADRYPRDVAAVKELAVRQWRSKVRMRETVQAMHEAGVRVFVEIGPRGNLSAFITDTLRKAPHVAVPLDLPRYDGVTQLCRALGMLAAHGVQLDLAALFDRRSPRELDFAADPPPAPRPDPPLRLDLPELRLTDDALSIWRKPPTRAANHPTTTSQSQPEPATEAPPANPVREAPVRSPAQASPARPTPAPSTPVEAPRPLEPSHKTLSTAGGNQRAQVFADYQRTMRQFLEMQQRVMARRMSRMKTIDSSSQAIAPPPSKPAESTTRNGSTSHRPSNGSAPAARPATPALSTASGNSPAPSATSPTTVAPPAAPAKPQAQATATARGTSSGPGVDGERLMGSLVQIVSDRTGYPAEMLDVDANLEADLGIDSIKRVEVIGAFRRAALPDLGEPPQSLMERLSGAKTLREIAEEISTFASPQQGGVTPSGTAAAEPPGASVAAAQPSPPAEAKASTLPFIESVLLHEPGVRLLAECELDVERHCFLKDHTLIGRHIAKYDPALIALPVMPLAMMLELLAEAAIMLHPDMRVVALTDVRTLRWLAFETDTRRVRIDATALDDFRVHVTLSEGDREGMAAIVIEGCVELGYDEPELGPPQVDVGEVRPAEWARDMYDWILFHGPAFQGIDRLEWRSGEAVRAEIHEPDPALMFNFDPPRLVLPVGLIDVSYQVPGMIYGEWDPAEPEVHMVYPNRFARLEVLSNVPQGAKLTTSSTLRRDGKYLYSELETTTASGEVVLRVTGRRCLVVDFPTVLHHYSKAPDKVHIARPITELFAETPGIEHCTVCEVIGPGGELLTDRLWSHVVARLILGREERGNFAQMKIPPRETASWLVGRLAAKDAVRLHTRSRCHLADVAIIPNGDGKPHVTLAGEEGPLVSLSHKGLLAVSIAAPRAEFRGIGIDLESLGPMDPGLIDDAFTPEERRLLDEAAAATGEPLEHWCLAGWAAKESFGKALGRGVIGGPRAVEIREIDPALGRLALVLRGPMLREFPEFDGGGDREIRVDAYRRVRNGHVLALCLLPKQ